jgi:hypothetical protein
VGTDAQIASLLLAFTLPIRRYHWYIDPNGARDEVVKDVANDFNLPVDGQDPKPMTRRRDRFSHDRHPVPRAADDRLRLQLLRAGVIASMKRPIGSAFASSPLVCRAPSPRFRSLATADLNT